MCIVNLFCKNNKLAWVGKLARVLSTFPELRALKASAFFVKFVECVRYNALEIMPLLIPTDERRVNNKRYSAYSRKPQNGRVSAFCSSIAPYA